MQLVKQPCSFIFIAIILLLMIAGCDTTTKRTGPAPTPPDYREQIDAWVDQRIEDLKAPTGWMRLAGLYVLDEGENSFGSGPDQDISFPEGTIARHAGSLILQDSVVTIRTSDGVQITHDGNPVDDMVIYDGDNAPVLNSGSLEWLIIQRQDLIAVRLYNKENPKVDQFDGFDRYPTDPSWHLYAHFEPNPPGTTVSVPNVLGQVDEVAMPGTLSFSIDGEEYRIQAIDASDDRLFLIIGDETNETDTYPAGRYMYVDKPDENGTTIIDFNKIYNPPCAYNPYSTCQLPPSQNRLDVAITAGEKRPVNWSGR